MMPTYSLTTLQQLAAAGSNFYQSLLADHNRNHGLTVAQIKCLEERQLSLVQAPAPRAAPVVEIAAIEKAFASAKASGIKYPKLRLDRFMFSPAPATGANPGAVYVVDERETYLGKVLGGRLNLKYGVPKDVSDAIASAVNDPHAAAVAYGKRFGRCSVCSRTLTNEESINLGIGPICRQRFGW